MAVLSLATAAAHSGVADHGFILLDDRNYITDNRVVAAGLTVEGFRWAFTTWHSGNWYPLTWLSHMTDVQLFGLNPAGHHVMSLAWHCANTALLFASLHSLTGAAWRSALVSALFGLHPLHVESVAWVAERKDLLCAFFWLLTLWAYGRFARSRGGSAYLLVVGVFALGLLAKPMLVTLPFVLLLLDYWPLGRFAGVSRPLLPLLIEKLPLFLLAAASSIITFLAQQAGGAVRSLSAFPLSLRIAEATQAYAGYLRQTTWPSGLAAWYPPADAPPSAASLAAACALLTTLTVFALRQRRRHPYLLAGWLWYLGTLVPVIGLVQVGGQSHADRYTYLPLIGVFLAVAWGVAARAAPRRDPMLLGAPVAAAVIALSAATLLQVRYWRDTASLFEHAVSVTEGNWMAYALLGSNALSAGRPAEAVVHLRRSLAINPYTTAAADIRTDLGRALAATGDYEEAIEEFRRALRFDPGSVHAREGLAAALAHGSRRGVP